MLHPDTELRFINDDIGFGVFATKLIPKGTVTWVIDSLDQILTPTVVNALDQDRHKLVAKYSYRNREGMYILCWDIGRYVNHSFHANCFTTADDFDIAVKDIQEGEELTNEYGLLNLDEPIKCLLEKGSERTQVSKEDIFHYYKQWDRQIRKAMHFYDRVKQPLQRHLPLPIIEKIKLVAKNKKTLDSVRLIYFKG